MAERGASSQDAFERSPKRTQLIEIISDSDSELPNIGFSRLPAHSQRARVSVPRNPAVARDSKLVEPEARRVENEGDEGEAEPKVGLALVDDHSNPGPQATIESNFGVPDSFTISKVHHDSPLLMAHCSNPTPVSPTSDTLETFGDAGPSEIPGRATTLVRSLSTRPALVEAVATESPTVGAVETYLTDPGHFRSTGDTRDNFGDTGVSRTTSVATALQESDWYPYYHWTYRSSRKKLLDGAHNQSDCFERHGRRCRRVCRLCPINMRDLMLALLLAFKGKKTMSKFRSSGLDNLIKNLTTWMRLCFFFESISNNMWNQLSEKYPQHTANQWGRLYLNKVLPAFDANRVVTSLATRKLDQLSSGRYIQSDQNVQSPREENHAMINVTNRMLETSPIARTSETQNVALLNATRPLSGAIQGQPSHPQAYIQGSMRFTNCG
jgi:hypothetical protein